MTTRTIKKRVWVVVWKGEEEKDGRIFSAKADAVKLQKMFKENLITIPATLEYRLPIKNNKSK